MIPKSSCHIRRAQKGQGTTVRSCEGNFCASSSDREGQGSVHSYSTVPENTKKEAKATCYQSHVFSSEKSLLNFLSHPVGKNNRNVAGPPPGHPQGQLAISTPITAYILLNSDKPQSLQQQPISQACRACSISTSRWTPAPFPLILTS